MDVDAVSCSFAVIFGTDMDKFVVKRNDENEWVMNLYKALAATPYNM